MNSKKNYYFPLHLDSGNRGCEAIARGTVEILSLKKDEYYGLCSNIKLDREMGLTDCATLISKPGNDSIFFKIRRKFVRGKERKRLFNYKHLYNNFMNFIGKESLMFITGGDMLCYSDNEISYINNNLVKKGRDTILWGCSVGEENLTPEKIDTIKKFSLITARESITEQMLKNKLKLNNVYLFPDPAFVLHPEEISLPDYFVQDCVGINLSNFVGADVGFDTLFGKNILALINYILKETSMDVVLVPHVFWKGQDDRIVCTAVYEQFKNSNRVHVLDSEKMNYCQIRYAISKCRFFIGARTHAMI
jgi:polysaccharide pyruvyl transferase WcaK-like protein